MKPLITLHAKETDKDLEYLREEYHELFEKNEVEKSDVKRNVLLTPFLLSIPVIIILFILISGSSSDLTSTVNDAPLQHKTITTPIKKAQQLNTPLISDNSGAGDGKSKVSSIKK